MEVDMVALTKQQPLDARPTVHQVAPPDAARALGTLPRIDYEDAFRISGLPNLERGGEAWARAVLEDTPASVRAKLVCGWCALGLRLGAPWSARRVLGWEVRHSDVDFVVLGADGCLGLSGELLFKHEPNGLLFATFVREQNPLARAVWSRVQDNHRQVVHLLLVHAARRVSE